MAFKPPPISDVFQQFNDVLGNKGLKGEVDKSVRSAVQSALGRLDVVTREEFDTQSEVLNRTRGQVLALEAEIEELTRQLDAQSEIK